MYKDKNILAIIPARGGSKGVPYKNIYLLGGKPLINWTLDCTHKLKKIMRTIVSTDDIKIVKVVEDYGQRVPFLRSKDLSGDKVKDFDVVENVLKEAENYYNTKYDIILLLQPTSPFRDTKTIIKIIDLIIEKKLDSIWTVTETDLKYHPVKQLYVENDLLKYTLKEGLNFPIRQSLRPSYHVNGYAYAFTRECIFTQRSRMGNKTAPYIIKDKVVNIDTYEDFKVAESYINTYLSKLKLI